MATQKVKRGSGDSGANLGFEATLWQAADKLRNNMDAAECKHLVLGLIFLKYISDAFEEKHAALEAERGSDADPEDQDEYRADNIFWVPKEARWTHLQGLAKQPTIGKLGTMIDRVHRDLTDDDIAKIADTYHRWRGDGDSPVGAQFIVPSSRDRKLDEQFAEGARLEKVIRENLRGLGYGQ